MAKYGMPYMGSKSGIAEKIIDILPKAPVLYDLFGGGGAISHCAALSRKWRKIVYNDINYVIVAGFKNSVHGGFDNERRWISRNDFFRLKDSDPYVNLCFSFGNKGNSYAYAPEVEKYKKALHYAVAFDDFSKITKLLGFNIAPFLTGINDINERRLIARKTIKDNLNLIRHSFKKNETERLFRLQHFERLEQIKHIGGDYLNIDFYHTDYKLISLRDQGIIYCDIPYENTAQYAGAGKFDHKIFYEWCNYQSLPIYVSSYEITNPHFKCIASIKKRNTLNNKVNTLVHERVYRYIK